jgi:beta-phosphoglucomutase
MNKPNRSWAVLWDVDGTLVDTAELHFQAWVALAREIGKPFTRADFAGTFGWRNPEIIPKLFGIHDDPERVAQLGERKEHLYREEAKNGVSLLPGVGALLESIEAQGGLQAIGSSAPRHNIDLILELTRTASLFAAVISMEDTSRGKPHPDVFLQGAKRLGIEPSRCIVLEDAPVGIQAAKAGGMRAVGVTFVGHHSEEKLRSAGADVVVPSLDQIDARGLFELLP